MKTVLPAALPDFSTASILLVGDVMLDRYYFGEAARISPEAPVPVVNISERDDRPGGAANVALNLATLGARVVLLGLTGKDEAAQILSEQLSAVGVTLRLSDSAAVPTITKQRVLSRHQQLIRLDFEKSFATIDHQRLHADYREYLPQADIVILSDYGKGTLQDPQFFIRLAQEAGVPVLVDPKGRDFTRYTGACLMTPNLKEFEAIVGSCANEQDILQRGQQLIHQLQLEALLLTRGEQGMTLIQPEQEAFHLPAYAHEVYDVTGAGDTVLAVLGASLAAQFMLPQAVALANLAASIVVTKLGTAAVSLPELEGRLKASTAEGAAFVRGVVNEEQLLSLVQQARSSGKTIVFTNGCFDILHAGHVSYLQQAKELGDCLIVAINDDASVRQLKGPGRPINHVEQRALVLAGLGVVDWVVSYPDATPERLLKRLKPDVLVKGGDYRLDQVVGAHIVSAYGGDVQVLRVVNDTSTTMIIDRVLRNANGEAV